MIERILEKQILKNFYKGKAIIILGARQVGKTTLVEMALTHITDKVLRLNADEADVRDLLTDTTSTRLRSIIGNNKIIFIDEAQRISNIGITIKLFTDQIKDVQVIVTGSSSFDLANKIKEPLTGRKYEYQLFPLAYSEMVKHSSKLEERRLLEQRLVFGYYPEIIVKSGEARDLLKMLSDDYLYKDLLSLEQIKKPALLEKILAALALQLGNEVSYTEIGQLVGADKGTVEKYVDLLEKSFVIFKLPAFSRNLRNEIKKGRKIYFYDNGIRNAIIRNFNSVNLRNDIGALWENFLISERLKYLRYSGMDARTHFWRTAQQQEIDYIEVVSDKIYAYEFKWNINSKARIPKAFIKTYPDCYNEIITPSNFEKFVGVGKL